MIKRSEKDPQMLRKDNEYFVNCLNTYELHNITRPQEAASPDNASQVRPGIPDPLGNYLTHVVSVLQVTIQYLFPIPNYLIHAVCVTVLQYMLSLLQANLTKLALGLTQTLFGKPPELLKMGNQGTRQ